MSSINHPAIASPPATRPISIFGLQPAWLGSSRVRALTVWAAFGLLSLIWGSSYLFIRVGVRQLSPESLVAGRLLVGFAVIAIIVAARRISIRVDRRVLVLLVVQGAINTAIPFLLISFGEVHVPSGLAAVLNGTVPIFTMLLAGLFLRDEPLSGRRLTGAAIGFLGVLVLMSGSSFAGSGSGPLLGEVLILLSSVFYGCGVVFARRLLRGVPSMSIAFWAVLFAAVESAIAAIVTGPTSPGHLGPQSIFAILWLGILGSGIAYVLAYFVLSQWGASRLTLVAYAMPAVGLVLGITFLGEPFEWRVGLGFLLIVGSIAAVSARRAPRKSAAIANPNQS